MSEPPPEAFTIVSDLEFAMLRHLPEFAPCGNGLVRRDDPEQFVFPQSEWDRIERIRQRVELECEALDASISTNQPEAEMERLLAAEVKPKVITKVETKKPKHVETEQELHRRLFIDPPNHPTPPFGAN